jgi:hypothetical protein
MNGFSETMVFANDHFIINMMKRVASTLLNLKINLMKSFSYNCKLNLNSIKINNIMRQNNYLI